MVDGTVERQGKWIVLRYERHLRHPVEVVWRALTEPSEVAVWFGGRVDVDLRQGGEYVTYHETGDRVVDRITRLEPPRLFEHTFWVHLNPDARVTYELDPADGGCRLVLTHRLTEDDLAVAAETYGWTDPMAEVPRTAAGWHRLLDRLGAALDGTDPDPAAGGPDLAERYASQLR
jgi:uncharacterized protein YndB with AHSA1/START domain